MKNTELAAIIEKLGKDMAHYERKSISAYRDQDFETSRRYHEKALAMERRVAEYLEDHPVSNQSPALQSELILPRCLTS